MPDCEYCDCSGVDPEDSDKFCPICQGAGFIDDEEGEMYRKEVK